MKNKIFNNSKYIGIAIIVIVLVGLFFPIRALKINKENSISELQKIEINVPELTVMIRGHQKDNPVVLVASFILRKPKKPLCYAE